MPGYNFYRKLFRTTRSIAPSKFSLLSTIQGRLADEWAIKLLEELIVYKMLNVYPCIEDVDFFCFEEPEPTMAGVCAVGFQFIIRRPNNNFIEKLKSNETVNEDGSKMYTVKASDIESPEKIDVDWITLPVFVYMTGIRISSEGTAVVMVQFPEDTPEFLEVPQNEVKLIVNINNETPSETMLRIGSLLMEIYGNVIHNKAMELTKYVRDELKAKQAN